MAISLGEINFGLGPDTRRLEEAMKVVIRFGSEVSNAAKRQGEGAREVEAALRRQEAALISAYNQVVKLNDGIRKSGENGKLLNQTTAAYQRMTIAMVNGKASALQFQRAQEDFRVTTTRVQRALDQQVDAQRKAAKAAAESARALREQDRDAARLEIAMYRAQKAVENYQRAASRKTGFTSGANVGQAFDTLQDKMTTPGVTGRGQKQAMAEFERSMRSAGDELKVFDQKQRDSARAAKEQATAIQQVEKELIQYERLMFNAQRAVDNFNSRFKNAPMLSGQVNQAMSQLQSRVTGPGGNALEQTRAMQAFENQIRKTTAAAQGLAQSKLGTFFQELTNSAVLITGPLSGFAFRLQIVSGMLRDFGAATTIAITGMVAAGVAVAALGATAISAAKQILQVRTALQSVTGSTVLTDAAMAKVMDLADRTGQSFVVLSREYAKMTAAARGTNLEGERTDKIFASVVYTSAKMGFSAETTSRTLAALTQIMSKGTVQAEELRGQLGDQLPGAFRLMEAALGVGSKELNDLMKGAQVSSDSLVEFAHQLRIAYGIDLSEKIETVTAAEGRLGNAFLRFGLAVDEVTGASTIYMRTLDAMANGLDVVGRNFGTIVKVVGALGGALLAVWGPQVIAGFAALAAMIGRAAAAMIGLNAAVLANPVGAMATILVRVGVAALGAVAGFKLLEAHLDHVSDEIVAVDAGVEEFLGLQNDVNKALQQGTMEYIKRQQVTDQVLANQLSATEEAMKAQREELALIKEFAKAQTDVGSEVDPATKTKLDDAQKQYAVLEGRVRSLHGAFIRAKSAGDKLWDTYFNGAKDPGELEPITGNKETRDKGQSAIKDQLDLLNQIREKTRIALMPEERRKAAEAEAAINKQITNTAEALSKAGVSAYASREIIKQLRMEMEKASKLELGNAIKEEFDKVNDAIKDAQLRMSQIFMNPEQVKAANAFADIEKKVEGYRKSLIALGADQTEMNAKLVELRKNLQASYAVESAAKWFSNFREGIDSAIERMKEFRDRLKETIDAARDTIKAAREKNEAASMPENQRKWAAAQAEVNKQVEALESGLIKGGVAAEQAAQEAAKLRVELEKGAKTQFGNDLSRAFEDIDAQINDARRKFQAIQGDPENARAAEQRAGIETAVEQRRRQLQAEGASTEVVTAKTNELRSALEQLIKAEQAASQIEKFNAINLAIKGANDSVRELDQQFDVMKAPVGQREWLKLQMELNKQIENYRDSLTRANVPAATVVELTNNFAESLRRVREGAYNIQILPDAMEKVNDILASGLDTGMDSFVDAVVAGEDAFQSLLNTAKSVLTDITKMLIQFAVTNPLKNALFGGDPSTGMPFPTFGAGGLIGQLINGGGALQPGSTISPVVPQLAVPQIPGGMISPGAGLSSPGAGLSSPFIEAARSITNVGPSSIDSPINSGGSNPLSFVGKYRTGVDPRLTDVLQAAAAKSGYGVEAFSGFRPGDTRYHGKGMATDIRLIDPNTGKAIPNYQNASSFRTYEKFAQDAYTSAENMYPGMENDLRWGGYFSGPKGKYGAMDQMHFDLGGGQTGMAGGSWQGGLSRRQRQLFPGAESVGLGEHTTVVNDTTKAMKDLTSSTLEMSTRTTDLGTEFMKTATTASGVGESFTSMASNILSGLGGIGGMGGGAGSGIGSIVRSLFGGVAKGAAFTGGAMKMALGGVLNGPTMFNSAAGYKLGGEDGPEALMPLTRNSRGQLSVRLISDNFGKSVNALKEPKEFKLNMGGDLYRSQPQRDMDWARYSGKVGDRHANDNGGGGGPTVNVYPMPGEQAKVTSRRDSTGKSITDIVIQEAKSAIIKDIGKGGTTMNKAIEGRYGLNASEGIRKVGK
jgi:tape measure domain-containing protein